MLEYVHQWQDIRRIWTEPTDPTEHATARVAADREYQRVALEKLRKDSIGHLARRLSRGVFILWAGEIPVRYSELNLDPRVFTAGLADPTLWTNHAKMTDVGANWYLNANTRITIDYMRTTFTGGALGGGNRPTEDALFGRLQVNL